MKLKRLGYTSLIFKDKEGATYVSLCPELSVASCGDSVGEARKRLTEAVRLFIEESEKMGTLQDILTEEGFTPKDPEGREWVSPKLIATEQNEVAFCKFKTLFQAVKAAHLLVADNCWKTPERK